jgi:hypothetical protein
MMMYDDWCMVVVTSVIWLLLHPVVHGLVCCSGFLWLVFPCGSLVCYCDAGYPAFGLLYTHTYPLRLPTYAGAFGTYIVLPHSYPRWLWCAVC